MGFDRAVKVTPEESKKIQLKLFSLGYGWDQGGQIVRHVEEPWLVMDDKDKQLYYSDGGDCHEYPNVTVQSILGVEFDEDGNIW